MEFGLLSAVIVLMAAVCVYVALHFLLKPDWFFEFLVGLIGFGALTFAVLLLLAAVNIATFNKVSDQQALAYIQFKKLQSQQFQADIVNVKSGDEQSLTLEGDLWQAKLQHLRIFGQDYYRLTQLVSRYYSLEQERAARNNQHAVKHKNIGLDLWSLFLNRSLGFISASEKQVSFLAMHNKQTFALQVEGRDIAAKLISNDNSSQ